MDQRKAECRGVEELGQLKVPSVNISVASRPQNTEMSPVITDLNAAPTSLTS